MLDFQIVLTEFENMMKPGIEDGYLKYLKNINKPGKSEYQKKINLDRDNFFGLYTSVSNYDKGIYDIRYKGQKIAIIKKDNTIETVSNFSDYFETLPSDLKNKSIPEGLEILYRITEKKDLKSKEHVFESRVLKYLNSSGKEILKHITPVTINGFFFQMPTFFSASNHGKETINQEQGGGIDILARLKICNASPRDENKFCIMELKDSITIGKEEPIQIMRQAIAYACSIQYLIRSKNGQEWYDFFREQNDSKKIPSSLILYACVVIPFGENFSKQNIPEEYKISDELSFANGDKLRLRYLYLEMNKDFTEIISEPITNLELKE